MKGVKIMSYNDFITTVGVIVTGFFTWLVWRATKETANATQAAADTAKATLKLNEDLAKKEELREKQFNDLMKIQLTPKILRESEDALNAIVDTESLNILMKLKEAPNELSIDKKEIVKYFSSKEVETITKAWELYEAFRKKYYLKSGFNNSEEVKELLNNSQPVAIAFSELINLLKYHS
jgi:hypothetical protein